MSCLFCDIINKIIPAKIVAENKGAIAFLDVNPVSDGHTLVISKKHFKNLSECDEESLNDVIQLTKEVANIIKNSSLKPWGFNYISNEEQIAGQVIMHFHMHVIPKYGKGEGYTNPHVVDNKFETTPTVRYVDDVAVVYKKILKASK